MTLIDTHAHLYADEFDTDLQDVVDRAKAIGVEKILLPNIDVTSVASLKIVTDNYTDFFLPMMGLHPTSVGENWQEQLAVLKQELDNGKYIAVGEIGIDLYWDQTYKTQQILAFEEQLTWSEQKQLPVAIHSRNAIYETINSIKKRGKTNLYGVFHSFGGTPDELHAVLKLEQFYIGINGVVTFKNSGLADTLKNCPLERIILETDSPYLAPVPFRGKRNESSYLSFILTKLSEIYNIPQDQVAAITTLNAKKLFNIV